MFLPSSHLSISLTPSTRRRIYGPVAKDLCPSAAPSAIPSKPAGTLFALTVSLCPASRHVASVLAQLFLLVLHRRRGGAREEMLVASRRTSCGRCEASLSPRAARKRARPPPNPLSHRSSYPFAVYTSLLLPRSLRGLNAARPQTVHRATDSRYGPRNTRVHPHRAVEIS